MNYQKNKMYIVFYKDNFKWWSRLIKWWTKGKYSHCEFYDGEKLIGISNEQRVRKLKQPLNKDKWDIFKLNKEIYIEKFYQKTQGKKYDWLGIILANIFNFKTHNPNKYTCSEWVAECIDSNLDILENKNYIQYTPALLCDVLKRYKVI